MNQERPLPRIIEAIIFASQKPVSAKELLSIFKGAAESAKDDPEIAGLGKLKTDQIVEAIHGLETEYMESGRAFEVRESAAGWQLMTRADFSPWMRQLFPENKAARLSAPALETLAIIAYRQPITRANIEAIRGVAVDGVMQTILDRGLIRIAGRADIPGRPLLYETTQYFLEHFGLKDLDDLPNAGELRKVSLPTADMPPADQTAQPEGSATADQTLAESAPAPEAQEATPSPEVEPVSPPDNSTTSAAGVADEQPPEQDGKPPAPSGDEAPHEADPDSESPSQTEEHKHE